MTLEELQAAFEAAADEYIKFERIESPKHQRPDLCAFLMLHEAVPGTGDMVCAAEHDEIYLDVDPEALAAVATPEMVRDLARCGVRLDDNGLCMFA